MFILCLQIWFKYSFIVSLLSFFLSSFTFLHSNKRLSLLWISPWFAVFTEWYTLQWKCHHFSCDSSQPSESFFLLSFFLFSYVQQIYINFACCVVYFRLTSALPCLHLPANVNLTRRTLQIFRFSADIFMLYFYIIFFCSTCLKTKRGCVNEYYFVACMHTKDINYRIHFIYELSFIHIAFYVCLQTCVWEKERESQSRFE